MQRTLLGVVLLALACTSANAAGYYVRFDTTTTSSAFQEFDGVTASSLTEYRDIYYQGDYAGYGYEVLSADLSAGRLATYQESNAPGDGAGGGTTVHFGDTLTFDTGNYPADVTLEMRVHGSFANAGEGFGAAGLAAGPVLLESAHFGRVYKTFDEGDFYYGEVDVLLSLAVRVNPGDTVAFWSFMQINHLGYGTADFANTAQMSVVVPDGVTFTSASGEFLTAVPIPATVWLLGSALGLMGAIRRKLAS